ncbi:MAG: RNA 2',3'-cyclic phosphodiesterase [bacterium]
MRTFIALELSDEVRSNISRAIDECRSISPQVKWVKQDNIHITLRFLGEVNPADIENVEKATRAASQGHAGFSVAFKGMDGFPNIRNPRVIWVGVTAGGNVVSELSEKIARELICYGFIPDERKFVPHVTIARIKMLKNKAGLAKKVESFKISDFGSASIRRIVIMESMLTSTGPRYSVVKAIDLAK